MLFYKNRFKMVFSIVFGILLGMSAFFAPIHMHNSVASYSDKIISAADSQLVHGGIYSFENAVSSRNYLAVDDSMQYDGVAIVQKYASTSGLTTANMRFRLENLGDNEWSMMPMHSARNMMVDSGSSNVQNQQVIINQRNGSSSQRFRLDLQPNGAYKIVTVASGYTWSFYVGSTVDGASVVQSSSMATEWNLTKHVDSGSRVIDGVENGGVYQLNLKGRFLDINDNGLENGTKAIFYDMTKGQNQKFRFNYLGNGDWEIVPTHGISNKALEVSSPITTNNQPISQQDNKNNWGQRVEKSQRFRIGSFGSVGFKIYTAASNYTMELTGSNGNTANGTQVVQSTPTTNNYWSMVQDVDTSAVYRIQDTDSEGYATNGRYMQLDGDIENGTGFAIAAKDENSDAQLFVFEYVGVEGVLGGDMASMYKIAPVGGVGRYSFDIPNNSNSNNTRLQLYQNNDNDAQKFRVFETSSTPYPDKTKKDNSDIQEYRTQNNMWFAIGKKHSDTYMGLNTQNKSSTIGTQIVQSNQYTPWVLERVVGTIGQTVSKDTNTRPDLGDGAPWGKMELVGEEYVEDTRLKSTYIGFAGEVTNTYETYNRYVVRKWRYELVLNAPVYQYEPYYRVYDNTSSTLTFEAIDEFTQSYKESITVGLSVANEWGSSLGIPLTGMQVGLSSSVNVTSNIEHTFSYESQLTLGYSTAFSQTVNNNSGDSLQYRFQHRIDMNYYVVQVFELQYNSSVESFGNADAGFWFNYYYNDLEKMQLLENLDNWYISGKIELALTPYKNDGFDRYSIYGVKDSDMVRYV